MGCDQGSCDVGVAMCVRACVFVCVFVFVMECTTDARRGLFVKWRARSDFCFVARCMRVGVYVCVYEG